MQIHDFPLTAPAYREANPPRPVRGLSRQKRCISDSKVAHHYYDGNKNWKFFSVLNGDIGFT